jgi:hypothetical protein
VPEPIPVWQGLPVIERPAIRDLVPQPDTEFMFVII